MYNLSLGISPCPNDTFIFGASLRGDIAHCFKLCTHFEDVQHLNEEALKGTLDVVKVSFGVYPYIAKNYKILKTGGALGFGCGPLVLSKKYNNIEELRGKHLVVPGVHTTAFTVFKSFYSDYVSDVTELRFDKIMPALMSGEFDAGLVIHEGRFTYGEYGLTKIVDMGSVWDEKHHLPIPLGCIAIKNDKLEYADTVNTMISDSIDYAYKHPKASYKFAKQYATDMNELVMKSHIELYVNEYSYDLTKAKQAIHSLLNTDDSIFA